MLKHAFNTYKVTRKLGYTHLYEVKYHLEITSKLKGINFHNSKNITTKMYNMKLQELWETNEKDGFF